ncbi:MAG: Rpn family recombination-promoting nuclease/putative transposase [Lachnospiraceae bacterium]|nr:Rpn family recombination-promoting nuclease/putative transposase [Lachnospiraceae bacterium]
MLRPDALEEMDTDASAMLEMKDYSRTLVRIRDVVKKGMCGVCFMIFGIEDQMKVHYAMPLRVLIYDALSYLKEYEKLVRENRSERRLSDSGEYLSGLQRTDRLHPVVTLVVYYGEEPWDGPLSLQDMLWRTDGMEKLAGDYKMNLLQVLDTDRYDFQNKDVATVFEISRHILKKEYRELEEKYKGQEIPLNLGRVIGTITGSKEILQLMEGKQKGGIDMCSALEELKQQGIEEGIKKGIRSVVENMLRRGLEDREIAELSGIPRTEVEAIRQSIG